MVKKVGKSRVVGPLGPCADGLRAEFARLGYATGSAENLMWWVGRLSRWMASQGVELGALHDSSVSEFLAVQDDTGRRVPTLRGLTPLLDWLRAEHLVPPASPPVMSGLDELLARYAEWLVRVRGLSERTIRSYLYIARRFLGQRRSSMGAAGGVDGLNGAEVNDFVLRERARGLAAGTLKTQVGALRTLLRFLHVQGLVPVDIAAAAPSVGGWHDTKVPPTMSASDVAALLEGCDRGTVMGLRDFAVLSLLARLGLRASEVAGLSLDDIDWRNGEIVVHGKGRRADRLPLPTDVGEAVAGYLVNARPPAAFRNVFLTQRAPTRPMHPNTISRVVLFACQRAGVSPVRAHRLRHALACELARQGESLTAIGQLLRHRDLGVTAAYAKVALSSLRQVAQPWKGEAR